MFGMLGMFDPQGTGGAGGGSTFSPSELFAAGEQGVWYDPSDGDFNWRYNLLTYTEQFDNAVWVKTGATVATTGYLDPVGGSAAEAMMETAVSSIHRVAQSSIPLTVGATYKFSAYVKGLNRTWAVLQMAGCANNPVAYFNLVGAGSVGTTAGSPNASITSVGSDWYLCTIEGVANATSGVAYLVAASADGVATYLGNASNGLYLWGASLTTAADSSRPYQQIVTPAITYLTYDPNPVLFQDSAGTTPVTAIEQPVGRILDKSGRGNHASQSTATARPILRNRYNLLTYTEQFDNAAWTKVNASISPDSTAAPDGTTTADTLTTTATGGRCNQTQTIVAGTKNIVSVAVKRGNTDWVRVQHTDAITNSHWTYFNTATGLLGTNASAGTVTEASYAVATLGNGWYRVSLIGILGTSTAGGLLITTAQADGNTLAVAGGTVVIWGASMVSANESTIPYQWVTTGTAGGYNTDTTLFKPFLAFDGTDDVLVTGNIDFSATDTMSVFAGVRKLSDAKVGVVAELSADIAANNGTFLLSAPNSAAANYNFSSKGTTQADNTITTYTSPITNVITGLSDISASVNIVRANAAASTYATSTQGTGNYGTYPLYIGWRGGVTASTQFTGRIYSLIIRNALTESTLLGQTETWVNGKTGAY